MGLDLEVGILADLRENDEEGYEAWREDFNSLNKFLKASGSREHTEPEDCEVWSASMIGYSGLHYLRRIAAHLDCKGQLPAPGDIEASADPVLEQYFQSVIGKKPSMMSRLTGAQRRFNRKFDHLIVHSDACGFYLPIDFPDVLFPEESYEIPGGMIGSAIRLLSECERIAAVLKIPPQFEWDSEELTDASANQGEGEHLWQRYGVESCSCVTLMQACTKSIETGAALVFC